MTFAARCRNITVPWGIVIALTFSLPASAVWADALKTFNPKAIADVPFVNGGLLVPSSPHGPNNRGVITDTTLPGMTHVECYLDWPRMEPEKDNWNDADFDAMLALSMTHGLKMLVLPCLCNPPEWMKSTSLFTPVLDSKTGEAANYFSPWAPGTYDAYDHFYDALASKYGAQIDIVKFPIEIGLIVSLAPGQLTGHKGFWCGDAYARADFRDRMLAKYGDLARLNAAWSTRFAVAADIVYPDRENRLNEPRRWVDFLTWYQESQTRAMVRELKVIRKHFPNILIDIPMGYGEDLQSDGCDRTGVPVAAAAFAPVDIRSTHAGFNRNRYPQAYWFYKRMAPTCHRMGIGFGTEPPGGNLSYSEMKRAIFEAASAGSNFIFQYFQNYHRTPSPGMTPHIIDNYKQTLRPFEPSLVDIGVLYPTTQQMLDLTGYPDDQLQFCAGGRGYFDYDLVDENMVEWNQLSRYRVIVQTSGTTYRDAVLPAFGKWLARGGALVTRGTPHWRDLTGQDKTAPWLNREDAAAEASLAIAGLHVYRDGKGSLYALDAPDVLLYLKGVVAVLTAVSASSPLHGFRAIDDGSWGTEFADGKLVCDSKTFETKFVAGAAK
ncbi:MAG: beta-galactosidase [Capsulimonadaceae bacterium]|nr:beta-galactosidase [Capsulimonadaceae bacterium]